MTEFVYFIRDTQGRIKVGTSRDPLSRMAVLQTGHATKLEIVCVVPGGFLFERVLHEHWNADRLNGEWFEPAQAILDFVAVYGLRALEEAPSTPRIRSLHLSEGSEVGSADAEALAAFLLSRHHQGTAKAVAERTGLPTDSVRKWLAKSAFPSGGALLTLVASYGPDLLKSLCEARTGAPRWVRQASAIERTRVLKAEIAHFRRARAALEVGAAA